MNTQHLALHGLALKKHAAAPSVAAAVDLPETEVTTLLEEATRKGRAVAVQGGWMLSPAGRMILDGQYARVYAEVRANPAFMQAYERFERINTELKQLITDWQTLELGGQKVRNDHSNREYDEKIIDRLADLHERFAPVLRVLTNHVSRLAVHARKLEHALDRVDAGAIEWVSDAKLESYHTVWFEMHEDLLRILGRAREE
jgi:hypothetical protein